VKPEDLGALMEKARAVQSRLAELQRDLAARHFEGEAGGGMVRATVSGALQVLEVRIEPSLLAAGDRPMLEDLVAAAVNSALRNAQAAVQQELQRAGAAMGVAGPGGAG
jgi:DNA-binding YbaB/EbfC family protein